ncbi:MAG: hypothetical protein WCA16_17390, partial [Candidatus Sulfotelmatobacter sp.]
NRKCASVSLLLALTAMLGGCSGGGGGGGGNGPAPTVTLSANPSGTLAGQGSTLTWTSTNATSTTIDNGVGAVQLNGSGTVMPSQTTTYTITATGNGQQATASTKVTVSSITVFDGLAEDSSNTGETDIDPNGAVGTKQYTEYVNTEYQAYDKGTHAPVWSTPQPIGTPWTAIPQCAAASIRLDAVIIFDHLASRWVIAGKATRAEPYFFCIAVSKSDDLTTCASNPAGCWYAYSFDLDAVLGTNSHNPPHVYLPDWPKLGTGPDAYYATMDLNDPDASDQEVGVVACAFDRTSMLAGVAQSANLIQCQQDRSANLTSSTGVYLAHSLIPADVDGTTPPPAGRDEYMVSIQNPTLDLTTSSLINLWDFHVDWTIPSSTLTLTPQVPVDSYTPGCYTTIAPTVTSCVPEIPDPTQGAQKIDSVGDRLMPRFAYRNFGTYESFLVSHTVLTGMGSGQDATQTGVRWYEFRGSGTPTINQQGLISPDANYFRFLPSIAQDRVGNAAVGYSVSNPGTDPAIDFSYWNLPSATNPSEVIIFNGTAEEITPGGGNGQGKWGSYSSMTVDPVDDCTFWYVNEYWNPPAPGLSNTTFATKIANFKIPGCQ